MSLKFSLAELLNPQKREEPARFYARSQTRETIGLIRLARDIGWGSTLTEGDITHVIVTLIERMFAHLMDGDCVELPGLGKFRYVISSEGAISRKAFNESYIRKVRVQFKPDARLTPDTRTIEFEQVLPVNVRKAAAKNL